MQRSTGALSEPEMYAGAVTTAHFEVVARLVVAFAGRLVMAARPPGNMSTFLTASLADTVLALAMIEKGEDRGDGGLETGKQELA